MKHTFHVTGIPTTKNTKEFLSCAFTQNVINFCKMMKMDGHTVYFYGPEESEVECDKKFTVITTEDQEKQFGIFPKYFGSTVELDLNTMSLSESDLKNIKINDWRKNGFDYSSKHDIYIKFNENCIDLIRKNLHTPFDFIINIWGYPNKPIYEALKEEAIFIEAAVGYSGVMSIFKVFASNAVRYQIHGEIIIHNQRAVNFDQSKFNIDTFMVNIYDTVIPHYIDPDDFTFSSEKDNYILYIGRIGMCKGIDVLIKATHKANVTLLIAGNFTFENLNINLNDYPNVKYIGYADLEKRRTLISKAKAVAIYSTYNEPFGMVMIESWISGTPMITPDFGAFQEYNIHGLSGFRCSIFSEIVEACHKVETLDPFKIREYGENFSLEKIRPKYLDYFNKLSKLRQNNDNFYEI